MAFDFGAALSSVGQVYPAAVEGQEIRRQRQADAAAVSQRAQAAQDEHLARQAQTSRENQLAALSERNANRFVPISSKPERGEDGRYYMLFMSPDNKIQRLPVEGNYDPNAEKFALLDKLGIPKDSELAKQFLTGVKPVVPKETLKQDSTGVFQKVLSYPNGHTEVQPLTDARGKPVQGKMPASSTTTTSDYHYIGADNEVHAVPTTRTTTRKYGNAPAQGGVTATPAAPRAVSPSPASPRVAPDPSGRVIGPARLGNQERGVLQADEQIKNFTNEVIPQIEKAGLTKANSPADSVKGALAWAEYKAGRVPSDPFYASIIRPVAAISIAGAAPWVRVGRGKYLMETIQQHLPHPWQTPARIYDNVKWLRDNVVPSSQEAILPGSSKQGTQTSPEHGVGDSVQYRGRPATILGINPDGSYQLDVK